MTTDRDAARAAGDAAVTRRRDALEINDSIVQGLTVIKYALELGDIELAEAKTAETLAAARRFITDLLTDDAGRDSGSTLAPGSMVRTHAATTRINRGGGA